MPIHTACLDLDIHWSLLTPDPRDLPIRNMEGLELCRGEAQHHTLSKLSLKFESTSMISTPCNDSNRMTKHALTLIRWDSHVSQFKEVFDATTRTRLATPTLQPRDILWPVILT